MCLSGEPLQWVLLALSKSRGSLGKSAQDILSSFLGTQGTVIRERTQVCDQENVGCTFFGATMSPLTHIEQKGWVVRNLDVLIQKKPLFSFGKLHRAG